MALVHKYAGFTAAELATDATFISWVKCPDESNDIFWKEYLRVYPSQERIVNKARIIVNNMHFEKNQMNEDRAVATWNRIHTEISRRDISPGRIRFFLRNWKAAAAILIILFGAAGYFLLFDQPNKKMVEIEKPGITYPVNDIAPGMDKAILTLADGSTIILDSTAHGAITTQGNVTVINLEGQLAYNDNSIATTNMVMYNTITTPRGGQYQLVLADGTKVWLNAASSLKFPTAFAGDERRVELTGEGYFEVLHNDKKPFLVDTRNGIIQVLGTHFNINAYDNEMTVNTTLLEGSIKVFNESAFVILKPGQQSVINKRGEIKINKGIDVDEVVAWKNGKFQFGEAMSIEMIMRQLARWYDIEVEYKTKETGHIGGSISRNVNVSKVLEMMEMTGAAKFQVNGRNVTVLPK